MARGLRGSIVLAVSLGYFSVVFQIARGDFLRSGLLVMETGAPCLYALLRRFARRGFVEALLLMVFFISSRNVINAWHTNVWSQTASILLVPPILWLTLAAAHMPPGRLRVSLAFVSGALWTLLVTQDFYTGWFVRLLSVLLAVGALLIARTRPLLQPIVAAWRAHRLAILAGAAGACLGALVFVWIYAKAYREQHGFPEAQVLSALIPRDAPGWSHPVDAARDDAVRSDAPLSRLIPPAGSTRDPPSRRASRARAPRDSRSPRASRRRWRASSGRSARSRRERT